MCMMLIRLQGNVMPVCVWGGGEVASTCNERGGGGQNDFRFIIMYI